MKPLETIHKIGEEFSLFGRGDPVEVKRSQFGSLDYDKKFCLEIDGSVVPIEVKVYRPKDERDYRLFAGVCIFHEEDGATVFRPISPDLLRSLSQICLRLKLSNNEGVYEAVPEEKQLESGLVWFQDFSPPLTNLQEFTQITDIKTSFLNIDA